MLQAQSRMDTLKVEKSFFVGIAPHLSYTGINTSAIVGLEKKNIRVSVGIKLVASSSYFPQKGVIGPELGLAYTILSGEKIDFFGSASYQTSFFRAVSRTHEKNKRNSIHEVNFSYGIRINLNEKLWIENSVGFGPYMLLSYDVLGEHTERTYGTTGSVRIGVNYRLF